MFIDKLGRLLTQQYYQAPNIYEISKLLKGYYHLHDRKELERYNLILTNFNRNDSYNKIPIFDNSHFSLNLIQWRHLGSSPVHNHENTCTFIVIKGKIMESIHYPDEQIGEPINSTIMNPGEISSLHKTVFHSVSNIYSRDSLTLHLYDK